MSVTMRLLSTCICLVWSVATCIAAQAEAVRFGRDRPAVLEISTGERIRLTFDVRPRRTIAKEDFEAYMASAFVHFGLSDVEDVAIRSVSLEWGGMPRVFLAESAFGDLHSPAVATIGMKGANLRVEIQGGDAATSYRADLEIAPYGVVSRRVYNVISGYEQVSTYQYPSYFVDATMDSLRKLRARQRAK